MTSLPRHKKTYQTLLILACAGLLLTVRSHTALAATGAAGGAIQGGKLFGDIAAAGGIFYYGLYVLMGVLSYLLSLIGSILDYAFMLNTYINPGQVAIVQQGWIILRDLANGVFILLLLWIAITIIFQLDQLGGKRFLVKIIMVALLINFSLAMVSTVFALANKLAEPFAKAMGVFELCTESTNASGKTVLTCPPPKQTLSKVIIANSQIHETIKIFTDIGALEAFKTAAAAVYKPQVLAPEEFGVSSSFRSVAQYFGAPPPAQAGFKETASGIGKACLGIASIGGVASATGVGTAVGVPVAAAGAICSFAAEIGVLLAGSWLFASSGIAEQAIKTILNLVIADAFLLITMLGILTAAIILLLRIVAMVFLGIFAPIAFLGIAFPKFGDKIWSRWVRELFNWAFTAPIFYFLLYLALLMLQSNSAAGGGASQAVPFAANFFKILNLVLFLFFLWAAVYMTRKTAGHFADVALNLGRRAAGFGLGVATGFAARGVARGALRFAPQVEKTMNAIGRTPLGLALGRRTQAYIQKQRKQAEGLEGEYAGGSVQYLAAQIRSTSDSQRIAAIGRVAAKENKMEALTGREEDVVRAATRLGLQDPILQKLPHLVTARNIRAPAGTTDAQAIERVVDKMNQEEKVRISKDAVGNTNVLDALWRTSHNNDIEQIGLKNKELQKAMFDRLNNMNIPELNAFRGTLSPAQDQRLHQYFSGHLANGTGLSWKPGNWDRTTRPASPGPGGALAANATYSGDTLVGGTYPGTLAVTRGTAPYTWRIRSGSPPPGITLTPAGTFAGTAGGAHNNTYTFDAEVTDSAGNTAVTRATLKVT